MAITLFPETGDTITQAAVRDVLDALHGEFPFVVSGLAVSDGGTLNADVASGEAMIGGLHVVSDAAETVALTGSATNYVYIDSSGSFTASTSDPGNDAAVVLAEVVTGIASITTITDRRTSGALAALRGQQTIYQELASASSAAASGTALSASVQSGRAYRVRAYISTGADSTTLTLETDEGTLYGTVADDGSITASSTQAVIYASGSSITPGGTVQQTAFDCVLRGVTADGTVSLKWSGGSGTTQAAAGTHLIVEPLS